MVIVFAFVLYYTKLNIFTLLNEMLQVILQGGAVDPEVINKTAKQLDRINILVLCGMVVLATITGVVAAHITLVPTREEFSQRKKFITAVAHELRTPLAVLLTSNEVAMYDIDEKSPLKKVIQDNIEEVKHLSNILNHIVIFSRIGTAESFIFEPVEIGGVLTSAINKLAPYAGKHSIDIEYTKGENIEILGNKTAVEQTFYNVIKNAINYSKPKGGVVKINTSTKDDFLSVSFTDEGIGISRKNMRRIFEPFFRANPDNPQWTGGTGLGLSLVFEVMKLHNGSINVESTLDGGSTFTLLFPMRAVKVIADGPVDSNSVSFSFDK